MKFLTKKFYSLRLCPLKTKLKLLIISQKIENILINIIFINEFPICQHPCRLSFWEQLTVETHISKWLKDGIIKESCSDFAAPNVLCKKQNGSYRLCADYWKLSKEIIKDCFPLPLIDDLLDKLQSSKVFSIIYLKKKLFQCWGKQLKIYFIIYEG